MPHKALCYRARADRVVRPYKSAAGRGDVGIAPYAQHETAAGRGVGEIGEAPPVAEKARRFRGSAPIGGHDSGRESVGTTVGNRRPLRSSIDKRCVGVGLPDDPPGFVPHSLQKTMSLRSQCAHWLRNPRPPSPRPPCLKGAGTAQPCLGDSSLHRIGQTGSSAPTHDFVGATLAVARPMTTAPPCKNPCHCEGAPRPWQSVIPYSPHSYFSSNP